MTVLEEEKRTYEYGVMKATSELATINAFGPERSIIVRPTLIVGPGDGTDRFPYWLARLEKGGDMIIPGQRDEVVQYIDVRDLAEWIAGCLPTLQLTSGFQPLIALLYTPFFHFFWDQKMTMSLCGRSG